MMSKEFDYTTQLNNIGKETIISAFKKRVRMSPDSLALVYKGKQYTFKNVDQISDGIAYMLLQYGVKKGDAIGVRMKRSELFMILPLAILKLGCIYVPIELTWPNNQLLEILDIANIKITLTDIKDNKKSKTVFIYIDTSDLIESFCCDVSIDFPVVRPEDTMCIFFTSGTTGTPRGVIHKHSSVYYMIVSDCYNNKIKSTDVLLYYMNFGFLFGHRIFQSIIAGVPLHIAPQCILQNFPALNEYLEKHKITVTIMPTQVAYLFSNSVANSSLRILEIGGSAVPKFDKQLPYVVFSAYGSTECLSAFNVTVTLTTSRASIGLPNNHTEYILRDNRGKISTTQNSGELLVTGPGLCVGYTANPIDTKEKFVTINDKKYFCTGDYVEINKDGSLSFLYRIDDMVKIHGLRVELSEISSLLMNYPNIMQVYTCVKSNQHVENLCSYYTTLNSHPIPSEHLSQYLSNRIQTYKIPDFFIHIKEFPLSERGKINKSNLPEPSDIFDSNYEEPINDVERQIAYYYAELLDIKLPISRNENFIVSGGDSLGQMMLLGKLYSQGYDANFATIKSYPVIKDLAAHIRKRNDVFEGDSYAGFVIANSLLEDVLKNNSERNINHFNINDIYALRERADISKIRTTLNILMQSHMMLRANVSGSKLFVNTYNEDKNFELHEIVSIDEGKALSQKIGMLLNEEKNVFSKCMLNAIVIHTPNKDYLCLSCSHCVSDAITKKIIAEDFCKIYDRINANNITYNVLCEHLEHHTYLDYSKCLSSLAQSDYCNLQFEFWNQMLEKMSKSVLSKKDANYRHRTTYKYSKFSIAKEESMNIIAKQDLFTNVITAFSRTINDIYKVQCIPINLVHHGREVFRIVDGNKHYLSLQRTVGCFPYVYPVIISGNERTQHINYDDVKNTINSIPDKGMIYNILKENNKLPKYHPIFCVDFIGTNHQASEKESFLQKTNAIVIDNVEDSTNFQSECFVYCMVYDSKIKVILRYDVNQFSDTYIERILTQFKKELLILAY